MSMHTIREWVRTFVYLDFLGFLAWSLVAVVLGTLTLLMLLVIGHFNGLTNLIVSVATGLAALALFCWMTMDARRSRARIHKVHVKEAVPTPDGDMSAVANLPKMPPWMGMGP
ncbi:MAG: hypothetical protein U0736_21730 [Gemmataceae bacterium]